MCESDFNHNMNQIWRNYIEIETCHNNGLSCNWIIHNAIKSLNRVARIVEDPEEILRLGALEALFRYLQRLNREIVSNWVKHAEF